MAYTKIEVPQSKTRHVYYSPAVTGKHITANEEYSLTWHKDSSCTDLDPLLKLPLGEVGEYKINIYMVNITGAYGMIVRGPHADVISAKQHVCRKLEKSVFSATPLLKPNTTFHIMLQGSPPSAGTVISYEMIVVIYELVT